MCFKFYFYAICLAGSTQAGFAKGRGRGLEPKVRFFRSNIASVARYAERTSAPQA